MKFLKVDEIQEKLQNYQKLKLMKFTKLTNFDKF